MNDKKAELCAICCIVSLHEINSSANGVSTLRKHLVSASKIEMNHLFPHGLACGRILAAYSHYGFFCCYRSESCAYSSCNINDNSR